MAAVHTTPAVPLTSVAAAHRTLLFHHHHHYKPSPASDAFTLFAKSSKNVLNYGQASRIVLKPPLASVSSYSYEGNETNVYYDPELRAVLELATDSELYEIERILFGPSYFSPLLKSMTKRSNIDHIMIGEDPQEREDFISMLESRFLFLAADARSTLRGWRPSYRKVLLEIRKKLNIPCSAKLSAEELEVEIFLHLLEEYASENEGNISSSKDDPKNREGGGNDLEFGLSKWKVQQHAALGIGASELRQLLLKGGGMLTLEKLMELVGGKLSSKFFTEAANYQIKKEVIKKAGKLAAINLESKAAFLAARQGLKTAAARYLGLRSLSQLVGPLMWGTLLADVVIQMLGTDYARILRAIYAFAQIRVYRSHRSGSDNM